MAKPKILKSKIVLDAFFKVKEDLLEFSDKTKIKYYGLESGETVCVLAINKDNKIVLNKEYRHPIRKVLLDLPAGYINKNETPKTAAKRELKEETGYEAGSIKKLGTFYPLSGLTDMKIHFFKAWNLTQTNKRELDEGEFIKNKLISIKDFKKKIVSKEIKDIPSVFCFLLYSCLN